MTLPINRISANASTALSTRAAVWTWDLVYLPLGSAGFGGAERSLLDLAGRMAAQGQRVLLLAEPALRQTPFAAEAAARSLSVRWVDWAPERALLSKLRVAWPVLRTLDARLLHFNISWRRGMWLIPLLARLASRARLIGSMRAMPDPAELIPRRQWLGGRLRAPQLWRLPDLLVGRIWARCLHLTVSVNRDDYPPRLIAEYGFSATRLRVIYNGISVPEQLPTPAERQSTRAHFGFSDRHCVVCYFGRLSSEKGVQHLLDALATLPGEVVAVLIGDGPQRPELEAQVTRLGLEARVRFAGFIAHPEPIVAAFDLVAVPSIWYEAFGRTVVEALAMQVPVVASRIGGMAELFEDGVHGHYVPAGDRDALAAAIAALATDPAVRQAMGRAGRAWVQERYAMERVAAEYARLYRALLDESGPDNSA